MTAEISKLQRIASVLEFSGIEHTFVSGFTKKSATELEHERQLRKAYLRTPQGQAALRRARAYQKRRTSLHQRPDPERSKIAKLVQKAY